MSDVQKIAGIIREFGDREVCYEPEELAEAIADALRPSFSEIVKKNNDLGRRCNLGHFHGIYKRTWRGEYPLVLRLYARYGSMTTAQLGKLIQSMDIALSTKSVMLKAPSELVDFELLELCGKKGQHRLYRLSDFGKDVLIYRQKCPQWVRQPTPGLTEQQQCGPRSFLYELKDDFPHSNKAAHVEQSIPSPVSV